MSLIFLGGSGSLTAVPEINFVANESVANETTEVEFDQWELIPDVAEYGSANWSYVHSIGHAFTVSIAKEWAELHPEITYFFYVKGAKLVINNPDVEPPVNRVFHYGDAVFFTGEPWWGSAQGLADGFIKEKVE